MINWARGEKDVLPFTRTALYCDAMMTNRLPKYVAWSVLLLIVIVTICPIGFRPQTLTTVGLDRAAAFAFCSAAFVLAYPRYWLAIIVAGIAAAFGIEALRFLSPTRHPHLMDAAVKAAGAIAGGLATLSCLLFRARFVAG
ncbi:MAG: antibiotic resistance protein VanZ [Agrobacterium fabrum]|uniref:Antibiotic resistance protein VanZ n=1 Tax=Agrobacterium fabrum TaxID=1176649 RepID=A0A2W5F6P7_9HYPH|nr:MAG: antibiotic resistance protein VanZ [Agrobacterium fabrum]